MTAQHTPGPWLLDFGREDAAVHAGVTIASISDDAVAWQANAHLIAAAPDLLAALRDLHACHRAFSGADNWTALDDDARAAAEAAIAKAEGR